MGLTRVEKAAIGKDLDHLIDWTAKHEYIGDKADNNIDGRFRFLKSRLITLKAKLYIESKDTEKRPRKRFGKR